MKTDHKLAETLKNMMADTPLESISVTMLAKRCHINRQTFYYHFHDIYDLLTLVFLDESIKDIEYATSIDEMLDYIFKYYSKNKNFVEATVNSAGKDLFQEFIYNNCFQTIARWVHNIPESKKISPNDRKQIARFYSLAYAHTIVFYLSTYKNKTITGLKGSFSFESSDNLKNAVLREIEAKGKE